MIGAGVFTTSGFTLAALHSRELVLAAWAVGGLIAIAGAVSYGQLARAMPESGGAYLFLSRAAHPLLGFIAGWVSLIAGFSGAIAFAATVLWYHGALALHQLGGDYEWNDHTISFQMSHANTGTSDRRDFMNAFWARIRSSVFMPPW